MKIESHELNRTLSNELHASSAAGSARRSFAAMLPVTISEPGQALIHLGLLLAVMVLLVCYETAEKPGLTAAGWRALLIPHHPSNATSVGMMSNANALPPEVVLVPRRADTGFRLEAVAEAGQSVLNYKSRR